MTSRPTYFVKKQVVQPKTVF